MVLPADCRFHSQSAEFGSEPLLGFVVAERNLTLVEHRDGPIGVAQIAVIENQDVRQAVNRQPKIGKRPYVFQQELLV